MAARSSSRILGRSGVLAAVAALVTVAAGAPALAAPSSRATTVWNNHRVEYPTVGRVMSSRHAASAATVNGTGQLTYHGGAVTTGAPKVYVVFWGSQWGTSSTDSHGYLNFSNDTAGMAPRVQALLSGIGTNGETWSGVMTQYCQGVASGSTSCPSGSSFVGYPTGGAFAGAWYDNSAAEPSSATQSQLATEAAAAALHFGNTSSSANSNAQYVVVSSTGLHPDGYNTPTGNFCAWHSSASSSSTGQFAYTNLPYIPDMGGSCGANYVNSGSAGSLDGVTIVEGHEYAETITDQFPSGGWWDSSGYENGDKCAWVGVGGTGGAQNVAFATGSFAMQSTYSNDSTSCLISHAIAGASTVSVNAITSQSGALGTAASVNATASDSAAPSATFTWSATGLPAGITIDSITGTMSGTPTYAGTYNVTVSATDANGSGSTSFTWTIAGYPVVVTEANQVSWRGVLTSATPSATLNGSAYAGFTWAASGLPGGITISSSTGTMSGTPTTAATYTVTLTATDPATGSSGSATFSWTVKNTTVSVTNPGAQSSLRGKSASLQMSASDSASSITTFTWSASGLPKGLSISSSTGLISGTVSSRAQRGTYTVTVTAKDKNGSTGSTSFTWTIS